VAPGTQRAPDGAGGEGARRCRADRIAPTLRQRQKQDPKAANYTARFRQAAATERLPWLKESFHRYAAANILTSTLVTDHPYFSGSGLGMGMNEPNIAWGGFKLLEPAETR